MPRKTASSTAPAGEILARCWAALTEGRPDEAERLVKALTALLKAEELAAGLARSGTEASADREERFDTDRLELERRIQAALARARREAYREGRKSSSGGAEPC